MRQHQYLARQLAPRAVLLAAVISLTCGAAPAADDPSAAKEKELIGVLQSATSPQKAIACKQLAIHGGKAAVPELAKLLTDEELASWARIALEAATTLIEKLAIKQHIEIMTAARRALLGV